MIDDDTDPPPTTDPRDYAGTDPLCVCLNPRCMPGATVGEPHEYIPHPDTPASVEEHRAAIVAEVKSGRRWPSKRFLRDAVGVSLGQGYHDMSYAQALAGLRLTDAQWTCLDTLTDGTVRPMPRGRGRHARDVGAGGVALALHEGGLIDLVFQAAKDLWHTTTAARAAEGIRINDAGRERHALGRGPR